MGSCICMTGTYIHVILGYSFLVISTFSILKYMLN